jgi:hypothetical protein
MPRRFIPPLAALKRRRIIVVVSRVSGPSSLPVLPVIPGQLTAREIESLRPSSQTGNAKNPVVQSKKGTGPISTPIQNFEGICLPFGPPCQLPSGCSCLPPDTNGEVGATSTSRW